MLSKANPNGQPWALYSRMITASSLEAWTQVSLCRFRSSQNWSPISAWGHCWLGQIYLVDVASMQESGPLSLLLVLIGFSCWCTELSGRLGILLLTHALSLGCRNYVTSAKNACRSCRSFGTGIETVLALPQRKDCVDCKAVFFWSCAWTFSPPLHLFQATLLDTFWEVDSEGVPGQ